MIKVQIEDGSGTGKVSTVEDKGGDVGLVVLTEPLYDELTTITPLLSAALGADMNVDAAFSGTPEEVHNGTDNAYWTGSNISGTKVTFNSTDRPNTGTKSVKVDNPALNNEWQFDKGSDLTVSAFVALTFAVNVDKDWSPGESVTIFGWDVGSGVIVGNAVAIEQYFDEFSFDVWQQVVIPLADMGLTSGTIDALRMKMDVQDGGKNPKFYIDDMQVEQIGTTAVFSFAPKPDQTLRLIAIKLTMADNVTAVSSYNAFLGVSALANGITATVQSIGKSAFSGTFLRLIDFLAVANSTYETSVGAADTWFSVNIPFNDNQVLLKGADEDSITFTITDDLSTLAFFRTFVMVTEHIT